MAHTDREPLQAETVPGLVREPSASATFEDFFRDNYRALMKYLMYAGASEDEAKDAVSATMEEVHKRWKEIKNHYAYARRVAKNNFVNQRKRGTERITQRLIESGEVRPEAFHATEMTVWESREFVEQLFSRLTLAQRQVMELVIRDLTRREIAERLGSNPAAVRQMVSAARKRLRQSAGITVRGRDI